MIFIPGLKQAIEYEIKGNSFENDRPSFFLFDIQDEQIDQLKAFFNNEAFPISTLRPMIRSRITSVNGDRYERDNSQATTREGQRQQRFRNRGANLSFAKDMTAGDKIIQGSWFNDRYDWDSSEPAELSIEQRYAKRLGLKMNDIVTFDVLGMPVEAKITSVRSVKWTNFNPNFFLILQPGVLDDAPKTWLCSTGYMSSNERLLFQEKMYQQFPNISLVDVESISNRLVDTINQMSTALWAMSLMSLCVALIVLATLIYQRVITRKADLALIKILGMTEKRITRLLISESFLISFLASAIGVCSGLTLVFIFSWQVLDIKTIIFSHEYWLIPTIAIFISSALAYFIIKRLQRQADFYRQLF